MKRLIPWIGAAAILVIVFGTMYATVQQSQRNAADSPQIQLAEDTAIALDNGKSPKSLINGSVSLNESLAPFVVIYDKSGKPVAGNGLLDNKLPQVPVGVLTASKGHEYHRVSWQPQLQVRIAAVTVASDKYYVLSGRSLKEVEKNEDLTFQLASIGCLGSLIVLSITYLTTHKRK